MPTTSVMIQNLLILQSFKETVWGTGGAATCKWMGVKPFPEFTPYRKATIFEEVRGTLAPGYLSSVLRKGGEYKIEGYLTYEDAILLGHNFFGIVTPTGSNPYVYSYVGYAGSQPNIQPFTFEFNQTGAVALATGCIANKLEIKGNASEQIEYTLSGLCADVDNGTGSPITSLADRSVEVAMMATTAVYMDQSGSTIGTTAYGGALMSFTLSLENSIKYQYTAGSVLPTQWYVGEKFKSELTLDLLYTTAVRTFLNNQILAGNQVLIRLKSAGTGSKYVQYDFAGVLAEDPKLYGEKEGAQMISVKLGGIYNTGAALHTNMTVANLVSAVP